MFEPSSDELFAFLVEVWVKTGPIGSSSDFSMFGKEAMCDMMTEHEVESVTEGQDGKGRGGRSQDGSNTL